MNLATAVRNALGAQGTGHRAAPGDRITWEIVQQITPDGRAVILGAPLSCSGNFVPVTGQRVPVLWKDGAPFLILGHRTRRAQFPPTRRVTAQGIIEELVVGNFDHTVSDVWYRNYQKFERLNLRASLAGHTPQRAKWRLDGLGLAVQCDDGYYGIFILNRPDASIIDDDSPGAASLVWLGKPLDSNVVLTTVTYTHSLKKSYAYWLPDLIYSTDWHWNGSTWEIVPTESAFSWGEPEGGSGEASVESSTAFGLADVLAGRVLDADGYPAVSATVVDWFLAADGHLQLLFTVTWDSFTVQTGGTGTGSLHYSHGAGGDGMGGFDETLTVSGTIAGTLGGGLTQIDHAPINEQHIFLVDVTAGAVAWATAPAEVGAGVQIREWFSRVYEHQTGSLAGADHGDPPVPYERYYAGASSGSFNGDKITDAGTVGEDRTVATSSTGTFQLFDPARMPALGAGPFSEEASGGTTTHDDLLGGGFYLVGNAWTYTVYKTILSGALQLLWYHRVQGVAFFAMNSQPCLFAVLERYPYAAGTGYLEDIPQIGVFILHALTGAVIRTLRDWQYGLAGAEFLAGNAHRIVWTLSAPWINPSLSAYVTDLATGVEKSFTAAQYLAWLGTQTKLLSPDFAWDYTDPKQFSLADQLPALTADDALGDLAGLFEAEVASPGSLRAANDETILGPLGKYLAT